ncbi:DMT family transporter [Ramlibacter albus]|jgi:drug/metabolite transporter (DMT)-like permease|nr:DMT family transporter [Ramlibacter albus]
MPPSTTALSPSSAHAQASLDNLKGIGWMVAAMAAFALEDAFVKAAARHLPIGEVLMLFGLGGMLVFAAFPNRGGAPLFHRAAVSAPMLVRAAFEFVGRLFYVLAVALTPLSSATAILQATPVLVVLGASVYFRERVGWRRWTAVVVGLLGVLVVLRPAASDFSVLSLLTLIGMVGFAGRDLASRAVPKVLGTRHLGFYGFLTVVLAGALYGAWDGRAFVQPAAGPAAALAGAVAIGVLAYACLMKAMRTGDVSTVTPFRYTRLLFGVALGVAVFDERIDGPMLAGCAIIVGAGLAIAWDGRRRRA